MAEYRQLPEAHETLGFWTVHKGFCSYKAGPGPAVGTWGDRSVGKRSLETCKQEVAGGCRGTEAGRELCWRTRSKPERKAEEGEADRQARDGSPKRQSWESPGWAPCNSFVFHPGS